MSKENKCGHEEGDSLYLEIEIMSIQGMISVGVTNYSLCESCRIKAQIELRDFINSSKYFKELSPFG